MTNKAAERLRDDKVRRDFLDELIFTGVVQKALSYDEIKGVTDRLAARIQITERKATVERIRAQWEAIQKDTPAVRAMAADTLSPFFIALNRLDAILDAEAER